VAAVSGSLIERSKEIKQALSEGKKFSFEKITPLNITNP